MVKCVINGFSPQPLDIHNFIFHNLIFTSEIWPKINEADKDMEGQKVMKIVNWGQVGLNGRE